jgi:hypothetical protein
MAVFPSPTLGLTLLCPGVYFANGDSGTWNQYGDVTITSTGSGGFGTWVAGLPYWAHVGGGALVMAAYLSHDWVGRSHSGVYFAGAGGGGTWNQNGTATITATGSGGSGM